MFTKLCLGVASPGNVKGSTKSLEDIRVLIEEIRLQETIILEDNRLNQIKSYSKIGTNVLSTLEREKLLTTYAGEGGLSSIMTNEDVSKMASLEEEYDSNCYVQCKLIPVFEEIGLLVINSERPGFEWLRTFPEVDKLEGRPDMIICNPCFYEARAQPNIAENLLQIQEELLVNGWTLLYGIKAGHPLLFLDDIHILEGKKNTLNDSDIG